ncbi:RBBP9/YdeN family alpha/beta hydrolase [Chitinimonas naiadis]
MHIVIHPGWQDSGPAHWQSLWQLEWASQASRVPQADWDKPDLDSWVATLDRHLDDKVDEVIVVCHSLGCLTLAHWAVAYPERAARLAGALLVAPADAERVDAPREIVGFAPIPQSALPFPAIVVASDDDPFCRIERSRQFATAWRSSLITLAGAGHINAASGFGDWPQGKQLLAGLLA